MKLIDYILNKLGFTKMADETVVAAAPVDTAAAPVADTAASSDASVAVSDAAVSESLPVEILDKLKSILLTAGHDIESVWDEAVALAKKLV